MDDDLTYTICDEAGNALMPDGSFRCVSFDDPVEFTTLDKAIAYAVKHLTTEVIEFDGIAIWDSNDYDYAIPA